MSTTTPAPHTGSLQPEALATYLGERLERRVVGSEVAFGQLTVTVEPAALPMAAQLCRDDPRLAFDFFDFISGVDEREDGFAVVVHLYSTSMRHHVSLRALAAGGRDAPRVPTISHLYGGADWHEREAYDMFGIVFDGHPGLLPRILTVENFEGFPLRKEFLLMSREVKPWPGLKEPKEDDDEADGDGDDEVAGDPIEAAAIADNAVAKDAAAGAVGGDTAAGAPGDAPGADQPIDDAEREQELAGGAAAHPSGTPGVEAEGRHGGADAQGGDVAASDTVGMTSDTQDYEAAPSSSQAPSADAEDGLPPRGPGEEEPRALSGDGVETRTLDETVGSDVGPPIAVDDGGQSRPIGTDADDRLRDREAADDDDDEGHQS